MLQDFNLELQDDSSRQVKAAALCCLHDMLTEVSILQVSITLVSLHQECLQGNFSRIHQLKQHMNSGAQRLAKSQQEAVCSFGLLSSCLFSSAAAYCFDSAIGCSGVHWHCIAISMCTIE